MLHAAEPLSRSAPHPLTGAVWGDQLRVGCFQLQQLSVEAVVDRILHFWSIQHVVGVGGPLQQLPQFAGAGLVGGSGAHGN